MSRSARIPTPPEARIMAGRRKYEMHERSDTVGYVAHLDDPACAAVFQLFPALLSDPATYRQLKIAAIRLSGGETFTFPQAQFKDGRRDMNAEFDQALWTSTLMDFPPRPDYLLIQPDNNRGSEPRWWQTEANLSVTDKGGGEVEIGSSAANRIETAKQVFRKVPQSVIRMAWALVILNAEPGQEHDALRKMQSANPDDVLALAALLRWIPEDLFFCFVPTKELEHVHLIPNDFTPELVLALQQVTNASRDEVLSILPARPVRPADTDHERFIRDLNSYKVIRRSTPEMLVLAAAIVRLAIPVKTTPKKVLTEMQSAPVDQVVAMAKALLWCDPEVWHAVVPISGSGLPGMSSGMSLTVKEAESLTRLLGATREELDAITDELDGLDNEFFTRIARDLDPQQWGEVFADMIEAVKDIPVVGTPAVDEQRAKRPAIPHRKKRKT